MKGSLEIVKDKDVKHTRYATLNHNGIDAKFFERSNGKTALTNVKEWANKQGYTNIILISTTYGKQDKKYLIK